MDSTDRLIRGFLDLVGRAGNAGQLQAASGRPDREGQIAEVVSSWIARGLLKTEHRTSAATWLAGVPESGWDRSVAAFERELAGGRAVFAAAAPALTPAVDVHLAAAVGVDSESELAEYRAEYLELERQESLRAQQAEKRALAGFRNHGNTEAVGLAPPVQI